MSEPHRIRYRFDLPDGSQKTLDFTFDAGDFRLANAAPRESRRFGPQLTFNQCANCPLNAAEHPHCPAALQMASGDRAAQSPGLIRHGRRDGHAGGAHDIRRNHGAAGDEFGARVDHGDRGLSLDRPLSPDGALPSAVRERSRNACIAASACSCWRANWRVRATAAGSPRSKELYENLHVVNRDMSRRLGAAAPNRSRAQCDGAARRLHDVIAGRARILARGTEASFRRLVRRANSGDLTYRDSALRCASQCSSPACDSTEAPVTQFLP